MSIVWIDGYCQFEKARIHLFGLSKLDEYIASLHSVRGEIALPRVASDEHCVSDSSHECVSCVLMSSVRMYGEAE